MSEQQPESSAPQDGAPDPGSFAAPPPAPPNAGAVPPPPPPAYGAQPQGAMTAQPLSDSDARMWAMLGHLGGIILGFIAPLITWLVFRERSEFVEDQGKESLNFQITLLIAYVVSWILVWVVIGFVLLPLVWIANIVLCIIAGLAANKGERYRYPFALRLIK